MSRVAKVDLSTAPEEIRLAHDELIKSHALTNMKAVALNSPFVLKAMIVELTTFGAPMIVNSVFNSAVRIDVDDVLDPYRIDPEQYFA